MYDQSVTYRQTDKWTNSNFINIDRLKQPVITESMQYCTDL